ncbi:MAG: glycosyltransferase [Desulfobaccales bacterium]
MEVWQSNRQAAGGKLGGLTLPEQPPELQKVRLMPGPPPLLAVPGPRGNYLALHGRRPWEEAHALAAQVPLLQEEPLVALGLGLGYHLLALLPRLAEGQTLVVVEPEPEVVSAALSALDLSPVLNRPQTYWVVEPEPGEAARQINQVLGGRRRPPRVFGHPASLRARPSYYEELLPLLTRPATAPRRPPGLRRESLRVLVVNPDYFLIPEVLRAFRHLGHEVGLISFDKRREPGEEVLRRILAQLTEFRPDLLFTINHLGVDREGVLLQCLERLRVPLVSWFVDSPALILDLYAGAGRDLTFIFSWDPTYIPRVRALGFVQVHPLPLATDPEIFRPSGNGNAGRYARGVSFVGNSLTRPVAEKLARLPQDQEFREIFQQLTRAYLRRPYRDLATVLEEEGLAGHVRVATLRDTERVDLEAAMIWAATREYRLECVRRLGGFHPVIYGDSGWRELVGPAFRLEPEVRYYDELPRVYAASQINFNATSLQMKAAVNQRVFDVPAAGGFLLTDFREQLAEVLEPGREVICYRRPEEIPELVRFYLRHPAERRRLAQAARKRVLSEHTYRHRVQTMLAHLRRAL